MFSVRGMWAMAKLEVRSGCGRARRTAVETAKSTEAPAAAAAPAKNVFELLNSVYFGH